MAKKSKGGKNRKKENTKYRTGALIVIFLFALSLIGGALNAYFSRKTNSVPKSNIIYGNLTPYQIEELLKNGKIICIYTLSNNCSSLCYKNLELMKSITMEFKPFVYLAITNDTYGKSFLKIYTYNNITTLYIDNKTLNQTAILRLFCSSIPYNIPACIAQYT